MKEERKYLSEAAVARIVQGWRERERLAKEQAHSDQFSGVRQRGGKKDSKKSLTRRS